MPGIYKWTSPTNRVYVGQSKDLDKRKKWYMSDGIRNAQMPKLKRSFNKYGIDNHIYDIIEHCTIEQLDEKEIHWGLFYNTLEHGLNCKLGEQNSIFSESTKRKMSAARKGIPLSPEHQANRIISLQKYWDRQAVIRDEKNRIQEEIQRNKPPFHHTPETKKRISEKTTGVPKHTKEFKSRLSEVGKKRDMTKCINKGTPVLQYTKDGVFIKEWNNSSSAEKSLGKYGDGIRACIRGDQKSAYGFIWSPKE
jgi:group I intron endonuclease